MKNRLLKPFIVVIILIVVVILFIRSYEKRHSVSAEKFESVMTSKHYVVFDSSDGRSGDMATDVISKVTNYDTYIKPRVRKEAVFAARTQAVFMIFNTEENAVMVEKRYENEQSFKVYKEDYLTSDYMAKGNKPVTRKGDNFIRYYTKTLSGDFVLISQIDNTLLVAYIDKLDIEDFNVMVQKLGY